MNRTTFGLAILALVAAACAGGTAAQPTADALEPITVDQFVAELEASTRPTVVNLWASWCIPCRSEAPLLAAAHTAFGEDVNFLGIATEDAPSDSAAFIEEFGLTFANRADRAGAIRAHLSGIGMPVTVFVRPGGEILRTHYGVIDDAALALGIDDLLSES